MMELELVRIITRPDATVGALYQLGLERRFLCFSLEDEFRVNKVPGETRIPPARYRLKLRRDGTMHIHYGMRFRDIHKGMLWLQDVPNFEYVYLHVGNTTADTRGCILVGDTALPRADSIGGSEAAYRRVYSLIVGVLASGGEAHLTVADFG